MEDNDSSGEDDSDAEFNDGEDTYSNKRRRAYGKDRAVYGIFGEDSEDEDVGRGKRSDWTKAPVFVSKDKVDLDKEMRLDEDLMNIPEAGSAGTESSSEEADTQDGIGIAESSDGIDNSQDPSRVSSPRIRDEEKLAQRPRMGGIGSSSKTSKSFSAFTKGGIGSSNLEASSSTFSPSPSLPSTESTVLPSAFGAAARAQQQRSFIRSESPAFKPAAAPLRSEERRVGKEC